MTGPVYAFDKLDGSNVRVEWSRKNGFHRWGRRHGLLDDSSPILKRAPEIFDGTLSETLGQIYRNERWESCTTFLEFWGWNSFAGNHDSNESQFVSVFDIDVYKRGLLDPKEFIDITRPLAPIPGGRSALLYHGNANEQFVKSVKNGSLSGMTFEGVVCKASGRRPGQVTMFKVKSDAWLSRLKTACGDDARMFEMLA